MLWTFNFLQKQCKGTCNNFVIFRDGGGEDEDDNFFRIDNLQIKEKEEEVVMNGADWVITPENSTFISKTHTFSKCAINWDVLGDIQNQLYNETSREGKDLSLTSLGGESTCTGCTYLVEAMVLPVRAGTWTVESLAKITTGICDFLPMFKIQHAMCDVIAGSVGEIAKMLTDGMAPADICKTIKFCPAVTPALA
jgi:hypothetical protein